MADHEEEYDSDTESLLAVESDVDSNFEESPVDGYFEERPHPAERFVENSSVSAEAEAKAKEAAQQRVTSSRAVPSSQPYSSTSPSRQMSWTEVETPATEPEAPPPDYEAAMSSPPGAESLPSSPVGRTPAQADYGSIGASNSRPTVSNTRSESPWPFGNRGSPFGPDQSWPLGNRNNPFNEGFPFEFANGRMDETNPDNASRQASSSQTNGHYRPLESRNDPFNQGFPFALAGGNVTHGAPSTTSPQNQGIAGARHVSFQSMSDRNTARPRDADEETGLLLEVRRNSPRQKRRSRCCKASSCCNAFLVFAIIVLIMILSFGSHDHSDVDTEPKEPSKTTPEHKNPTVSLTPITTATLQPVPSIPASAHCPYEYYSETITIDFNEPKNFSLTEFVESDHFSGGVSGTVRIIAGSKDQDSDIKASVTVATTRPWKIEGAVLNKEGDSLDIRDFLVQKTKAGYSGRPCIWIFVKLEVKPGISVSDFNIATGNLDILIEDSLFPSNINDDHDDSIFSITQSSSLYAVRGSVNIANYSSRETIIEVIAGSITGTFALRDLLSLKTQAGSIHATVDPRKADPERPRPAEFIATTKAGSINVDFPTYGEIPERIYKTRVESYSSSVHGTFILGEMTSITTESGQIDATLLPYYNYNLSSTLRTSTKSSSTKLTVLPPYSDPDEVYPAKSFHATTSVSGSIHVSYPSEWEGVIDAGAISGSIEVTGKGVEVRKDERLGPLRRVQAVKGDEERGGRIDLKSTSGSVRVQVGEQY